ncbi:MAG: hypothetical protein QXU75_07985, partial [Candidatus Methanomethylicaceae archaeon]
AIYHPEYLWEVEAIIANPDLQQIEALKDGIEYLKSIYEKVKAILNRDKVETDESERELISKLLQSYINILSQDVILAALRSGVDLPEEYCETLEDSDLLYASLSGGEAVGKTLYNRALLPPEQATWEAKLGYINECLRHSDKLSFIKIACLLTKQEKEQLKQRDLNVKIYTSDFEFELYDMSVYLEE